MSILISPSDLFSFSPSEVTSLFSRTKPVFRTKNLEVRTGQALEASGRLLIAISKKAGNAPTRNKIKRQIKAIFYENRLFERSHDGIILIRGPIDSVSFEELKNLLMAHL